MRIAFLGRATSWYLADLRRAADNQHEIVQATFSNLASGINDQGLTVTSGELDLSACDATLIRTMPPASLEQVVFRMDLLARLEAAGQVVLNPAKSIEVAVDKYLATAKLQAAGLPVPRTITCQDVDQAMEAFLQLNESVVCKPLFGGEGRGITRLDDEALAHRAFKMLTELGAVLYLQEYIDHPGYDYRLLVLGDEVLGMRRSNATDWRTNVSRGAKTEPLEVTDELAKIARHAAAAVGAPMAGVDLLPDKNGSLYVLEVNAVPGWQALSRTLDIDVASLVLDLVADMAESGE